MTLPHAGAPATATPSGAGPSALLDRVWRQERATVLASVARRVGDLQLAEDAVQEAFATAAWRWPVDGVPDRPGAWLTTTAWRKALDMLRRERSSVRAPMPDADVPEVTRDARPDGDPTDLPRDDDAVRDDVLSLVLTCCHPALSPEAQVALTLRHVAGLTDRQIAAAFLIGEATATKRLVRARAKIRSAGIAFRLPDRTRLAERLTEVHAVIYLVFTEGHHASGDGPAVRAALCDEALWLARQLHRLAPDDAETTGLLALLLLQHARTPARTDASGRLLPYADQDRRLWDTTLIDDAKALLAGTGSTPPGQYQLQAAIALLHAAPAADHIDWAAIAALYAALRRLAANPVFTVNQAVAIGRARSAEAGLAVLEPALTDPRLARYPPLHAAHADLLARAGDTDAAADAWDRAADLTTNPAQRTELRRRATAQRAPATS